MKLGRLALVAIAIVSASPAAADLTSAREAWNTGDFAKAVAVWRPAANRGNADAQYNMGQAYRLGRGAPADPRIAQSWYEKAAQQGHQRAQSNLGLLLYEAGDRATAIYWIRKAAERGDPRAQYVYGTALFNGDGVTKDWARAFAMMTRAAAQQVPRAAESLATIDRQILTADRARGLEIARLLAAGRDTGGTALAATAPIGAPSPRIAVEPAAIDDRTALAAAPAVRQAPVAKPRTAARPPAPDVRTVARAAPAPPRPAGRWRVQLGAFDGEAAARARWAQLARRMPQLAGHGPAFERFGAFTRLRTTPIGGRAEAMRLCAAARAAGQDCFAIAP